MLKYGLEKEIETLRIRVKLFWEVKETVWEVKEIILEVAHNKKLS